MSEQKLETLAIHAGTAPDPTTKARITPIYQTSSYVFDSAEHAANLFALKEFGNIYTRIMNPTSEVLEGKITALEGGVGALAVASGHAAQFLAFHTLMETGCNIVAANKLYGGSLNQIGESFKKFGWEARFVDADDPTNVAAAIDEKTRVVFIESLANPGGVVSDIEAIAKVAHDADVPLMVDNTMATPMLCRPFEHGADIVVHSTTKFLNGHGNSIGGLIVDSGEERHHKGAHRLGVGVVHHHNAIGKGDTGSAIDPAGVGRGIVRMPGIPASVARSARGPPGGGDRSGRRSGHWWSGWRG